MTIGDWVQAGIGSVAALTSILAIIIAVLTLRQSAKMIEEESRPYITVYYTTVADAGTKGYFVVKNFGKTGARITRFQFDSELESGNRLAKSYRAQFANMEGVYLAPGQNQLISYLPDKGLPDEPCKFLITYRAASKTYIESVVIDVTAISHLIRPNTSTSNMSADMKAISHDLQEIIRQLL